MADSGHVYLEGVHPSSRNRLHQYLLTNDHWRHTTLHNDYVVYKQVGLPDYRHWNIAFIHSTRRRNPHEDTIQNERSTWKILYVGIYIDPDKIYLSSYTSRTFLVQGIYPDNDPQGGVKKMQDWSLSFYTE